jgi:glycosyltransferase involved in cell wall biosynthesis
MSPRVVFGVPVFNKAAYLEEAVGSLLAQTYRDLAVVVIDDRSDDDSLAVARRLAGADPRLEVHVNERRLGMLDNTRRAFALARERFPQAEFWALGSDHDVWQPEFVMRLVALLDAHPEAVLAYPLSERIDEDGEPYPGAKPARGFETLAVADRRERMRVTFRGMAAGSMIYGLFRATALDRHYRSVLVPDRLLLSELALRGPFAQAPDVLWQRRFRGLAELERQRRAFWPGGVPRHARLPWWLQHAGAFFWAYAVRGEGASSAIGRAEGARLARDYLRLALALRFRRRKARARRRVRRYTPRRLAWRARGWLLNRYGARLGPRMRDALAAMEGHALTRPLARRAQPRFERAAESLGRPREEAGAR